MLVKSRRFKIIKAFASIIISVQIAILAFGPKSNTKILYFIISKYRIKKPKILSNFLAFKLFLKDLNKMFLFF